MVLGKLDIHMQKNEIGPLSYTTHKINSKWIKDLNVRPETIKLLEENIEKKLLDIGSWQQFFGYGTKSASNKSKNKQEELHQAKSFCTAKETISKMKWQPTEWEKIFANETTDKGLISKI